MIGHDHDRATGEVMRRDGRTLGRELVKAGLAWWVPQRTRDETFRPLQAEARAYQRGLWMDPQPIPPWEFRNQKATP